MARSEHAWCRPAAVVTFLVVGWLACDDAAPTPPSGASSSGGDAAVESGGPADGGGQPEAASPRTSSPLLVSSNVTRTPTDVVADTNLIFVNAGNPHCPYARVGPCHVWACATRGADAVLIAGGAITLKGGRTKLQVEPVDGVYPTDRLAGEVWTPGASMVFAGAGGPDLPPFTQTLAAPTSELILTDPPLPDGGATWTMTADRKQDLSVAWSAPTTGQVGASVTTNIAAASAVDTARLYCVFDAAAQKASIPAAALAMLSPGASVSLLLGAETNAEVRVGGYTVLARLGRMRRVDVTLQ
ncbi:MAG: hypothetical protein JNL38_07530 [Myxococcales bacterium]|nr:hypothetical protein [Myxococcales bacterium]